MSISESPYLERVNALSQVKKRLLLERLRGRGGARHAPAQTAGGRLLAFVKSSSGDDIDAIELRAYCDDKLPAYMVPQIFIEVEEVPVTVAGKIDRRALQVKAWTTDDLAVGGNRDPDSDGEGPRDEIEEKLAAIWCAVLGIDEVSIYDNFFEVGGDSLQIIRILSRAAKDGLSIKPDVIFSHQP